MGGNIALSIWTRFEVCPEVRADRAEIVTRFSVYEVALRRTFAPAVCNRSLRGQNMSWHGQKIRALGALWACRHADTGTLSAGGDGCVPIRPITRSQLLLKRRLIPMWRIFGVVQIVS